MSFSPSGGPGGQHANQVQHPRRVALRRRRVVGVRSDPTTACDQPSRARSPNRRRRRAQSAPQSGLGRATPRRAPAGGAAGSTHRGGPRSPPRRHVNAVPPASSIGVTSSERVAGRPPTTETVGAQRRRRLLRRSAAAAAGSVTGFVSGPIVATISSSDGGRTGNVGVEGALHLGEVLGRGATASADDAGTAVDGEHGVLRHQRRIAGVDDLGSLELRDAAVALGDHDAVVVVDLLQRRPAGRRRRRHSWHRSRPGRRRAPRTRSAIADGGSPIIVRPAVSNDAGDRVRRGRPRSHPGRPPASLPAADLVSIHATSAPPSRSPAACSANASVASSLGQRAERYQQFAGRSDRAGDQNPADRRPRRPRPPVRRRARTIRTTDRRRRATATGIGCSRTCW